jgi:hypothetical protein
VIITTVLNSLIYPNSKANLTPQGIQNTLAKTSLEALQKRGCSKVGSANIEGEHEIISYYG